MACAGVGLRAFMWFTSGGGCIGLSNMAFPRMHRKQTYHTVRSSSDVRPACLCDVCDVHDSCDVLGAGGPFSSVKHCQHRKVSRPWRRGRGSSCVDSFSATDCVAKRAAPCAWRPWSDGPLLALVTRQRFRVYGVTPRQLSTCCKPMKLPSGTSSNFYRLKQQTTQAQPIPG